MLEVMLVVTVGPLVGIIGGGINDVLFCGDGFCGEDFI
jgi:hypothetical protein